MDGNHYKEREGKEHGVILTVLFLPPFPGNKKQTRLGLGT